MADLDVIEAAQSVILIGSQADGTEETPIGSTNIRELLVVEKLLDAGLDDEISITAGTPVEVKVGASKKADRKVVIIQPIDGKIKWGFSNTTQSFPLFKLQPLVINAGPNTDIWIDAVSGTVNVAIGEG